MNTRFTIHFLGLLIFLVCASESHAIYNPETGRWLSIDPIGENGGINLYGMTGNDLVNHIDVLGLQIARYQGGYNESYDVPQSKFDEMNVGQARGVTIPDWNFKASSMNVPAKDGYYHMTLSGKLYINIGYKETSNPNDPGYKGLLRDETGRTLRQHERNHANIWIKYWNQLPKLVNKAEGGYCSAKCAELARKAVTCISEILRTRSVAENAAFDYQAHFGDFTKQDAQEFWNAIDKELKLKRELNQIEDDFVKNGCKKMSPAFTK